GAREGRGAVVLAPEKVRVPARWAVESDEPRREIVETAVGLLAIVLEDEGVDLLLEELDVGRKRQDVLDRAVVQVESEPHETAFRGGDQRPLAAGRMLEEPLALDDRAQSLCSLREVGVGDVLLDSADPSDDGGVRLAEAEHRRRPKLRATEQREARPAAKRRLRLGADTPAGASVAADGEDAVEAAR